MIENQKLIENYIYFYQTEQFCIIPVYPDTITDSMKASFTPTNALTRSAPVFTYSNSGPRSMNISLNLHRDLMNDVNKNISNLKDSVVDFKGDDYVDTLIKYLAASALPRYKSGIGYKAVIPPMVAIRFGNEIFIKGVINGNVNIEYKAPILYNNKYAQVTITFNVEEVDPYSFDDVVKVGSFRGISKTFKDGIYKSITSGNSFDSGNIELEDNTKLNKTVNKDNTNISQKKTTWHTPASDAMHGGHGREF